MCLYVSEFFINSKRYGPIFTKFGRMVYFGAWQKLSDFLKTFCNIGSVSLTWLSPVMPRVMHRFCYVWLSLILHKIALKMWVSKSGHYAHNINSLYALQSPHQVLQEVQVNPKPVILLLSRTSHEQVKNKS